MTDILDTQVVGSPTTSKTLTGLTSPTHSSASSAERYHLDEFDTSPILVYKYRGGGLHTTTQKELCSELDKDEHLRVTKKAIERGQSYVEVCQNNLYLGNEHELYRSFPSYYQSLASIRVPAKAYLSRMVFGNYDNLYIVSPQSSPESSVGDPNSRSSTWGKDSEEDARAGA